MEIFDLLDTLHPFPIEWANFRGLQDEENFSTVSSKKASNAWVSQAILDSRRAICLKKSAEKGPVSAGRFLKGSHSFPKRERLRSSRDIRWVLDAGEKHVGRWVILYTRKANDQTLKAGFIVSKRIGQATLRNRVKRLMREAFRLEKHLFAQGLWLVFLARAGAREWTQREVLEEVARLAQRIKNK